MEQRQRLGCRPGGSFRFGFFVSAICQQDRAIAGREQLRFIVSSSQGDGEGTFVKGAVKQLAQFADARAHARINCYGPKRSVRPHCALEMCGVLAKSLDVLLRRSREKKQFVKVAVLDCIGFVPR